jgi:hypothetical protein
MAIFDQIKKYFDSFKGSDQSPHPYKEEKFIRSKFFKRRGLPHNLVPAPKWIRDYRTCKRRHLPIPKFEGALLSKKSILNRAILTFGKFNLRVLFYSYEDMCYYVKEV